MQGSVIWEAGARFSGQQILDFWAHGSGISRSSVSLYNDCTDGVSFRSQKISMANLNAANPGAIKIAGFNSWGWLHIQVCAARYHIRLHLRCQRTRGQKRAPPSSCQCPLAHDVKDRPWALKGFLVPELDCTSRYLLDVGLMLFSDLLYQHKCDLLLVPLLT